MQDLPPIKVRNSEDKKKLMAAAVFEIRILLSGYLGSDSEADTAVRLAAHLAYALHNEALTILEDNGDFDLSAALAKIEAAEKVVGSQYTNVFGTLSMSDNTSSNQQ